ncbi:MAG: acyl-CoA dehydratase activase [Coriobacteriales bacterium]|jgi:predicted CoA-substrate-specific enzyme activase
MGKTTETLDKDSLRLGLDIGSTTVKGVVVDGQTGELLYSRYERHHARLSETAKRILQGIAQKFPDVPMRIGVCGSGGRPVADALGAHYIQEVVANTVALRKLHPTAHCAIELGGQDAKVVFFETDSASGKLVSGDMRMNGSCAGGTGAFLDEIATLLGASPEELNGLAEAGEARYSISGRCGVFAKTDIQPLLMQGARREDIARSAFHSIAKQTIGGLSQGLELSAPIVFEGGPLTYNPVLIEVFAERLGLCPDDIIIPEHPETIVARGAALAVDELFPLEGEASGASGDETSSPRGGFSTATDAALTLEGFDFADGQSVKKPMPPLFSSPEEKEVFDARHDSEKGQLVDAIPDSDGVLRVFVGVDSGSTTSKLALINDEGGVIDTFYAHNSVDPVHVIGTALSGMHDKYAQRGIELKVAGLGTTGYGEELLAHALGADVHTVETVAHAKACTAYVPDATFLLDIGGQDMKAIWLDDGVISDIMLNEACSSGCGSFLENFADMLGVRVEDIADVAFSSSAPANLGSRCTVFMNSSIITEQRNGKTCADILAGLCRSIIENVFTKVVRVSNTDSLGDRIVVQGGTFRNRAVLRALEQYLGKDVICAPFPGEMGAIGVALLAKEALEGREGGADHISGRSLSHDGIVSSRKARRDTDAVSSDRTPVPVTLSA